MEEKLHLMHTIEKNGKNYVVLMPGDGNLGDAWNALYEMLEHMTKKINEAVKKAEPKKPAASQEN